MTRDRLEFHIDTALDDLPAGALHVGFSGGLDSSVLLDLLAASVMARTRGLRAVHVDHGLHADSARWAAHCRQVADALDVPIAIVPVAVDRDSGLGIEAAARNARFTVFEEQLGNDGIVALAHHRDDQSETILLKLLRGAGPEGLGAMRRLRPLGRGWLWRPLLDVPRSELRARAEQRGLVWIDDPSNAVLAHDRNFVRLEILPRLRERWPETDANLARSAAWARDAADFVDDEARHALVSVRDADPAGLHIGPWLALAPALRDPVLRLWLRELGLQAPTRAQADELLRQLTCARPDRLPLVRWQDTELRRYRDQVFAMPTLAALPAGWEHPFDGTPLRLPAALGVLSLVDANNASVRVSPPLGVRFRRGGERLRLPGRAHRSELRDLFQQAGVPPWQRERVPILVDGNGEVIAVVGHWIGAEAQTLFERLGCRLDWQTGAH